MVRRFAAASGCIMFIMAAACAAAEPKVGAKAEQPPVKIGALLHVTGEFAPYGQAFLEGALLAVDKLNAERAQTESAIELILEDTQYRAATANAAARRLLDIERVAGAIITTAHEAKTAGPMFEASKTPIISLWDSAPELDDMGRYVFGIGTWAPASGEVAAQEAVARFGAKRAAIFASSTDWALAVAKPFEVKFRQLGGEVVAHEAIDPGTTDLRSVLLRAKRLAPDVIYAPIDDNIPSFFRQLMQTKFEVPVVTSDIITEDLLVEDPGLYDGVYQTQSVEPTGPEADDLRSRYVEKYGKAPGFFIFTAWGFDGVMLLGKSARAVRCSASQCDREALTEALYGSQNITGASGRLSIDRAGSSRRGVGLYRVKGEAIEKLPGS